jgi:molecular chaperone HscB
MAATPSLPQQSLSPTHFERLGVPRRFAVDLIELERSYLARSRETHPDFQQETSQSHQRTSLEMSAALNDAYATLKQPFRRAEYLLEIEGGPSAAEHKEMSPAFLEEMLDLRMEIEELRDASDSDSPRWLAMEQQLVRRNEVLADELARRFAQYEELPPDSSGRRGVLVQIRQVLNAAKYIQGLLRDLRAD